MSGPPDPDDPIVEKQDERTALLAEASRIYAETEKLRRDWDITRDYVRRLDDIWSKLATFSVASLSPPFETGLSLGHAAKIERAALAAISAANLEEPPAFREAQGSFLAEEAALAELLKSAPPSPVAQESFNEDDGLNALKQLLTRSAIDGLGSPEDHLAEIRKQLRSVIHVGT
ncbi:hypothetical protein AB7645_05460 [Bradyrhizobium sp. 956_D2_N1_5]|uniref:hypothetical protein n=1 Tax=unclassified Bradyrhizobium TaxID=2631580 RepID=UPI003F260E8D